MNKGPTPGPEEYRELPPVGALLERLRQEAHLRSIPADLQTAWVREGLQAARDALRRSPAHPPVRGRAAWIEWIADRVLARQAERLAGAPRRVINATGVLLHTNLGRSPYPAEAMRRLFEAAGGYSNLEMDLSSGRRCSRLQTIRELLPLLTGAEAGLAVHNNAAAVFLALNALASGREVIVSRGHLVEIGGSFRLPEIMAASGAHLVEVGSTNRTRTADYEKAITSQTAMVLKVHPSNFRLLGFTEEAPTSELAELVRRHDLPLMYDVGSGALRRHGSLRFGEPTVEDALEEGADLVCFSGDKLLGGPQAGILVGRGVWIERLAKHPLARVVRLDKTLLALLTGTLEAWLDPGTVRQRIPLLALLSRSEEELADAAAALAAGLRDRLTPDWTVEVLATPSAVGGGSLPGVELPSRAVALGHPAWSPDALARALRTGTPSVAGRIEQDRYLLDVRALLPDDVADLVEACAALGLGGPS